MIETAASILAQSQSRLEMIAHNMANIATPGYKRMIAFSDISTARHHNSGQGDDMTAGKIMQTDRPYDLAVSGPGYFVVRSGELDYYSRGGRFERDDAGRLIDVRGMALQAAGGGDLILAAQGFRLEADGTVIEDGEPVARVAVVDFADGALLARASNGAFTAPVGAAEEVVRPAILQGAIEASNVSSGDEMVAMMAALRRAESGQRVLQVYDGLMDRALSAFGQSQP